MERKKIKKSFKFTKPNLETNIGAIHLLCKFCFATRASVLHIANRVYTPNSRKLDWSKYIVSTLSFLIHIFFGIYWFLWNRDAATWKKALVFYFATAVFVGIPTEALHFARANDD